MPEVVNTSFLGANVDIDQNSSEKTMIEVDNVSMVFNIASETMNNLKEYAIALARRELRFKEFRALNDISFEVKKGDVYGILGTNGSGKSTLLKIIAGVLEPSEGTCKVNGNIAPLIELGAGFDRELTARENVYLNGALLGYPKSFIEERFDEIIEFAEIEKFLDMPLKNYSSGMIARIAFAIATVVIPDILIVDEVLSVGDFMFRQKCEQRISSLINDHQVTVLIVSHNNDQIERLCNKAIWIEKGHARMLGPAQDVCEVYRMIGGREGAPESENHVTSVLFDKSIRSEGDMVETIQGDNLYSYSAKIAYRTFGEKHCENVILTPSGSPVESYAAICFAKSLDAPVLTLGPNRVSDITLQALRVFNPSNIYCIGSRKDIPDSLLNEIANELKSTSFTRMGDETASKMALGIFERLSDKSYGDTAAISYPECTGDLTSLSPYLYEASAPLFFNEKAGAIDSTTTETITRHFRRLIVVGGYKQFPNESLDPFKDAGLETIRICASNPYEANKMINDWMDAQRETLGIKKSTEAIIAPYRHPENAFTIASYAGKSHSTILLEDPSNLNSISNAIEHIQANAKEIDNLLFLGDAERFSDRDKNLLEKALLLAKRQ